MITDIIQINVEFSDAEKVKPDDLDDKGDFEVLNSGFRMRQYHVHTLCECEQVRGTSVAVLLHLNDIL